MERFMGNRNVYHWEQTTTESAFFLMNCVHRRLSDRAVFNRCCELYISVKLNRTVGPRSLHTKVNSALTKEVFNILNIQHPWVSLPFAQGWQSTLMFMNCGIYKTTWGMHTEGLWKTYNNNIKSCYHSNLEHTQLQCSFLQLIVSMAC